MHRLIVLLVAIGAWSPLVYAENIHETVRRIDEKLHELEEIGAGERGPPGIRGPAGPRGQRGWRVHEDRRDHRGREVSREREDRPSREDHKGCAGSEERRDWWERGD